ncbi:MAG: class I SAM-dependent methyltransferase [Verrucomicrobiota bacterium]
MITLAGNILKRFQNEGAIKTLRLMKARSRALVCALLEDRRRGISTALIVKEQEPEIADVRCHYYAATDYETFHLAMQQVVVRAGEDVFVDFGSGKGRIVMLAAELPFRQVIGVEFSRQLHLAGLKNLAVAQPQLRCADVQLLHADATQWKVPGDATVLFFFNPFDGEVLAKVCENIRRSIAESPRRVTLIYVRPEKFFEKEIAWQEWLTKKAELACLEGKVAIYETRP